MPFLANSRSVTDVFRHALHEARDHTAMPYSVFVPGDVANGRTCPLIVHFHGAGSRGKDNLNRLNWAKPFAESEVQKQHPCFILVPQCPDARRWVDTDWGLPRHALPPITPEMEMAMRIVSDTMAAYPVDTRRIYLTGQSMGGYAVWDIMCRKPDLFAAAVPVCGGGDETKAERIKDVAVWVFHGAKDGCVPVIRSRHMVEALKSAGGHPRYTEYEHVGHNAWEFAYKEEGLVAWLFQQSRPAVGAS